MLPPFRRNRRTMLGVALGLYLAVLAVATLSPQPVLASGIVEGVVVQLAALGAPATLRADARVELVLNALMIVPAVLLAALMWPRRTWRDWTATGFVVSLGVEVVQAAALSARSAQAVDVVANTSGALAASILAAALKVDGNTRETDT